MATYKLGFYCLEKENTKADLSERVIFQKPTSSKRKHKEEEDSKKSEKKKVAKQLLSFDQSEENEC